MTTGTVSLNRLSSCYGGKLAGRFDLGMLCVAAGSPNGYDTLDYNRA